MAAFRVRNAITGLTINHVSDSHSAGAGTLTATVDEYGTSLTWSAPGGTAGASVAILDGERQIVSDGDDAAQFVVVTRDSEDEVAGAATVLITLGKTTAERIAEVDEAITECLRAQSSGAGDVNVRRAELGELRKYRADLERELARDEGISAGVARAVLRGNF